MGLKRWPGLGLGAWVPLALAACGPTLNPGPQAMAPFQALPPSVGPEAGPEAGVPTPEPSPALSPLLPFWGGWPEAPGFLEAPLSGAARAHLVAGPGPAGIVGWAVDSASLVTYGAVFGPQAAPRWPLPSEAPGASVAPLSGAGPSELALGQVVAVEEAGDGDAQAEAGEAWRLSAQLLHRGGQSTPWREAKLAWLQADGQATGSWYFPPVGQDKPARWSLPPHPEAASFRLVVAVPSGPMPAEGWPLELRWVGGPDAPLPVRLRWPVGEDR